MSRPIGDEVTQEQVEALFDKDGDLREPGFDEDNSSEDQAEVDDETEGEEEAEEAESEEETEEEEESEEEESEEDDEAEEEEESEEIDWDEVDDRVREAHDKAVADSQKWQKAHGKLQAELTKRSQSQREQDSSLEELRASANVAQQWNAILEQHPELQQVIEREIAKLKDPMGDVPDYLKDDPAFQFMQKQNQMLEQRLKQFEEKVKPVETWQSQQREQENRSKLDGLLGEAQGKFKAMFAREWTEAEKTQVLKYMVENKFYGNGRVPVLEVFGGQYEKTLKTRQSSDLKAKAKKFGTRSKSVNAARASKAPRDANNAEDAIAMALADQGYGQ